MKNISVTRSNLPYAYLRISHDTNDVITLKLQIMNALKRVFGTIGGETCVCDVLKYADSDAIIRVTTEDTIKVWNTITLECPSIRIINYSQFLTCI